MKSYKELQENLSKDMASFLQSKGMNAKVTTTDQKKKETADLMAKKKADAANSPKPAQQPHKDKYPLGGSGPGNRSYSESYAPVGTRVIGAFKEKDYGKTFEYSKAEPDSWGAKHGLPHVIHLIDGHKRFAHVKGTVAHVATDEDEHGKPVIDKWQLKKHDKYVHEEVELDEVLKGADAGEYTKDFEKSDAPQFKGKSKEKRHQMAIAAYLEAKRKNK